MYNRKGHFLNKGFIIGPHRGFFTIEDPQSSPLCSTSVKNARKLDSNKKAHLQFDQ